MLSTAAGIVGDCAEPAFLVGMDGTILAWNSAASEFFGIAAWHAAGRNCALVVRGCSLDGTAACQPNCTVLVALAQGIAAEAMEMVARTGDLPAGRRPALVHHLPITHPDAGPLGVLHVLAPQPLS